MTTELTARRVAELVEFGEADAYEDLFRHAPPDLGLSVMRSGGAVLLIAPSLPIILFNRSTHTAPSPDPCHRAPPGMLDEGDSRPAAMLYSGP